MRRHRGCGAGARAVLALFLGAAAACEANPAAGDGEPAGLRVATAGGDVLVRVNADGDITRNELELEVGQTTALCAYFVDGGGGVIEVDGDDRLLRAESDRTGVAAITGEDDYCRTLAGVAAGAASLTFTLVDGGDGTALYTSPPIPLTVAP